MKYNKPHLSPELRAQITPHTRRDVKLTAAGIFFILGSIVLIVNIWPKHTNSTNNNNAISIIPQTKEILGAATVNDQQTSQAQSTQATTDQSNFTQYTVKNGDTLFNISQQYNVRWDLIAQINNLSAPYLLHAGQTLKIPQSTTASVPNKIYTVKNGETLDQIAKEFNITVNDIIAVNPNLQNSELITPGQVIKLP
jgi:LysM repeat protein